MSECNENLTQKRGSNNPIQSKIMENEHGGGGGSTGDNTIEGLSCAASVAVGSVVRLNGTTIVNALADSVTNSKVLGICVAKASSTECSVQVTGYTDSIFGGLAANTIYFLSPTVPGGLTTTPPTGSNQVVLQIGKPVTPSQLVISITVQLVRA